MQLTGIQELIFLDRYSAKGDRDEVKVGDRIVVITREDRRYPEKQVGVVEEVDKKLGKVKVRLVESDELFEQDISKIEYPLERTPDEMWDRMAQAIVEVETKRKKTLEKDFRWLLDDFRFSPGGRINAMLGYSKELTAYNCFVIASPKDSREGIIDSLKEQMEIMARGGGVGINLSTLRPRYSAVRKVNGKSSGAVSWADMFSQLTNKVEQGGSRRGALMIILADYHPDLLEFIEAKKDENVLNYCNISVAVSDDFMKAVKNDEEWILRFPDYEAVDEEVYYAEWDGDIKAWEAKGYPVKEYAAHRARDIWNKIIESAWASAEPGVVFLERANKESNSWYFNGLIATNPCGEQPLPSNGVCLLGHINLSRFVEGPIGRAMVNWDELKKAIRLGVRFLDNVIDYTGYHDPFTEANQKSERRVGMGTLGLGEMLIRLGIRYGSDDCVAFLDELYRFIAVEAYKASIDLAEEKGHFPKFEYDKFVQSGFMQRLLPELPEEYREKLARTGIRNVTLTTQAPTGSTGTMIGTSTGIEPYYQWEYYRQGRLGKRLIREAIVDEWLKENPGKTVEDLPPYFVTAMDLTPEEHIRVQATIQRWVCSAISKTVNAPNSYTIEDTKRLYELAYELGAKGVTIYRDGSRNEQVLSLTEDKEKEPKPTKPTQATKPTVGEVAVFTDDIMNGKTERIPTPIGKLRITTNFNKDGEVAEVLLIAGKAGKEVQAWAEFAGRLISTALKYGAPLEAIVKQGRHIAGSKPFFYRADVDEKGAFLLSGPDAVAYALERYLEKDDVGTLPILDAGDIVGDTCEACGSGNVVMDSGCLSCRDCGYSACS